MNSMVKTLSIISMAAAMGLKVKNSQKSGAHIWRGQKLEEAARFAASRYGTNLNPRILKQSYLQIKLILGDTDGKIKVPVVDALCFLNCGLLDIRHHGNKRYHEYIDIVLKRLVWMQRLYDPRLDQWALHKNGFYRYEEWTKRGGKHDSYFIKEDGSGYDESRTHFNL